jgi:hypothetical protein
MADNVLERALRKRETLAREMAELDQFIAKYKSLSNDAVFSRTTVVVPPARHTYSAGVPLPLMDAEIRAKLADLSQEKAALLILDEFGPMSAKDMVARLEGFGFKIGGKDPAINLSSVLSHSKRALYDNESKVWIKTSAPETAGQRG